MPGTNGIPTTLNCIQVLMLESCSDATQSGVHKIPIGYTKGWCVVRKMAMGMHGPWYKGAEILGIVMTTSTETGQNIKMGLVIPMDNCGWGWRQCTNLTGLEGSRPYQLKIDLEDWEGNCAFVDINHFRISNEDDNYRVLYSDCESVWEGEHFPNNLAFSTKDKDNDTGEGNCAVTYKGAWWYSYCHSSNLNGMYWGGPHDSYADGVNYSAFKGYHYSLKSTVMKIRPMQSNGALS